MSYVQAAVYSPPRSELPYVAVVFAPDGEVLTARKVPSIEAGERLIQETLSQAAKDVGVDVKVQSR